MANFLFKKNSAGSILPGNSWDDILSGKWLIKGPEGERPAPSQVDISAELAMIDEMYAAERGRTQTSLAEALRQQQGVTADSLAGRGVYSSPVSEHSFGANRTSYANALADALAQLSSKQAYQKAQLSSDAKRYNAGQMDSFNLANYEQDIANQSRARNLATGLVGSLLGKFSMGRGQGSLDEYQQQPQQSSPYNGTINGLGNNRQF